MFPAMSDDDRRSFRTMLGRSLRALVKEAAKLDDPADLEQFSADLLPAEALSEIPDAAAEAVAVIADVPGALTLLRGMAAAAPPPLSTLAAEAVTRLGQGPTSVAAELAGTLVPERAWRLDLGEPVSCVMVECRRPGVTCSQVLAFTLEWPLTDGAIKDGFASAPVDAGQVEQAFLAPGRAEGIEPLEISPAEAVELVAMGAARCAEAGLGPSREALLAVTLLLRAAGRLDADELLEPLPGLPSLADVIEDAISDDLGDDGSQADVDELVDELRDWCDEERFEPELRDRVVYAGGCMADFRAHYLDGEVGSWNVPDLEMFLVDFVPRMVGLDDEDVGLFPGDVAEVLRFLGETGWLDPAHATDLGLLAVAMREEFVEEATDPSNWGPAKGMFTAMSAAGVDVTDEAAVQAWIDRFNDRTREEREQLVPSLAQLPTPPGSAQGRRAQKDKSARAKKAQRQARKRNRRR